MTKTILILFALFAVVALLCAQPAAPSPLAARITTLALANPPATNTGFSERLQFDLPSDPAISGINVYWGTNKTAVTNRVQYPKTNLCIVKNLPKYPVYFIATCRDVSGNESLPANVQGSTSTTLGLGGWQTVVTRTEQDLKSSSVLGPWVTGPVRVVEVVTNPPTTFIQTVQAATKTSHPILLP